MQHTADRRHPDSIAVASRGELPVKALLLYVAAQIFGGIAGVWAAHLMFELPLWQTSATVRTGPGQWFADSVATLGLVMTIFGCVARTPSAVPYAVGLYITSAYCRVHILRQSGGDVRPLAVEHLCGHCAGWVIAFIGAQLLGMLVAVWHVVSGVSMSLASH